MLREMPGHGVGFWTWDHRASTCEIVGAASGNAARTTDRANLWARIGSWP